MHAKQQHPITKFIWACSSSKCRCVAWIQLLPRWMASETHRRRNDFERAQAVLERCDHYDFNQILSVLPSNILMATGVKTIWGSRFVVLSDSAEAAGQHQQIHSKNACANLQMYLDRWQPSLFHGMDVQPSDRFPREHKPSSLRDERTPALVKARCWRLSI